MENVLKLARKNRRCIAAIIPLVDVLDASNYARRLKTLSGLTPYEYICKIWISKPDLFILNPIQKMTGLNS